MANADADPPEPDDKSPGNHRLIEIAFPDKLAPLVWLAIAVGLLLVAAWIASEMGKLGLKAGGSLLLASGIAIVLAAFGGQATVRGRAYVLAGVAAIAAVFVGFLEYQRRGDESHELKLIETQKELANARAHDYAQGWIDNIPPPPTKISLRFGKTLVGSPLIGRSDIFSFLVLGDQIHEVAIASLRIEPVDEEAAPRVAIAIPTSCIERGLGSPQPFDWSLRTNGQVWEIVDHRQDDRVVGRWGAGPQVPECEKTSVRAPSGSSIVGWLTSGWTARADEVAKDANTLPSPAVDITAVAGQLSADDVQIRRAARDTLSTAAPEQVPAIVDLLKRTEVDYRTKLGVAVALTEMLRRDKSQGEIIAPLLTDTDRNLLLDLSADPDRTIRVYATEFLYDLGDPAVTTLAIARAAETHDDTARYNWLVAAQDGWRRLPPADRTALKGELDAAYQQSGAKTRLLFEVFQTQ